MVERVSRPLVGIIAIVVLLLMAMKLLSGGGGAAPAPTEAPAHGTNGWTNGATNGAQGFGPVRQRAQAETLERPEATAEVLRGWLGADGQ